MARRPAIGERPVPYRRSCRGSWPAARSADWRRHDLRLPEGTLGGHLRDVGNLAEMTLKRFGDRGRDSIRAGTRQPGGHHDGGKVHLRQRRDGQPGIGQQACKRDGDGQERGGDSRAMNGPETFTACPPVPERGLAPRGSFPCLGVPRPRRQAAGVARVSPCARPGGRRRDRSPAW